MKTIGLILLLLIASFFPIVATYQPMQPKSAKFVLAGWSYPDEYGQGIYAVTLYQWYDPAWINLVNWYPDNITQYELNSTLPLKIQIRSWLNNTVVGSDNLIDGQNYINYTVLVTTATNSSVFYTHDLTLSYNGSYVGDTMFMYHYDAELDFTPQEFTTYNIALTYDIFEPYFTNTTAHVADSGTGDYADSLTINSVYWSVFGVTSTDPEYAYFIHPETTLNISGFNYAFYGHSSTSGLLRYYNGSELITLETITSGSDTWYNGTHNGDILNGNNVTLAIHASDAAKILDCDYLEINWIYSQWVNINTFNVVLVMPMSQETEWALNNWYILFGMGLVVSCGVYLVKGGRKELSMNKFFIVMVMFMLGWGLIIGGVTP